VGEYFIDLFPHEDPKVPFRSLNEIMSDRTDGLDVDDGVGWGFFFCEDAGVAARPSPLLLAAASLEARPFFFFFGILVSKVYNL
jgi:hypothetical protein